MQTFVFLKEKAQRLTASTSMPQKLLNYRKEEEDKIN